jgi:hypothetical protein
VITESIWQSEKAFRIAGESSSVVDEWGTVHSAERTLVITEKIRKIELSDNIRLWAVANEVDDVLGGKVLAFILRGKKLGMLPGRSAERILRGTPAPVGHDTTDEVTAIIQYVSRQALSS